MGLNFFSKKNLAATYIRTAMDDSQEYLDVKIGTGQVFTAQGGLALITTGYRYSDLINAERVKIIQKGNGAGGGDQDHFIIQRNYDGNGARAHLQNELLLDVQSVEHFVNLEERIEMLEFAVAISYGILETGVKMSNLDEDDLLVIPTNPASMAVTVNAGVGVINRKLYRLAADFTTPAIASLPLTSRIDLVQAKLDGYTISVKEGDESVTPVAPEPDADCMGLAEILLTSATTEITVGELTDVRAHL